MAATSLVAIRPARPDAGDIFRLGAPAPGSSVGQASPIANGDVSVSSQTGALSYSYPVASPPGRNNMQPQIALSYSSQGPIYGTVASQWAISGIHLISQDTSNGRMVGTRYQTSMAGNRPLVPVADPPPAGVYQRFRAQNDSSWTRYEQLIDSPTQARWRAFAPDGTTFYFGETAHGNCAAFTAEYAPLTTVVDKFGNQIFYSYSNSPLFECRIDFITWGQNPGANVLHFATMKFNWAESPSCIPNLPIGSQFSWRSGQLRVTGASRLTSITVVAHAPGVVPPGQLPAVPDHRRDITLSYDTSTENCATTHAPYRRLASIQQTASGIDSPSVTLPATTFTYGSATFGSGSLAWPTASTQTVPWNDPAHPAGASSRFNLGWGYRFPPAWGKLPTVEEMMVDIDGDSRPDRLTNVPVVENGKVVRCQAKWQRNRGWGNLFDPPLSIALPTLKWASPNNGAGGAGANPGFGVAESCSLNYQQTAFVNSDDQGGFLCPDGSTCAQQPNPGYCSIGKYDCGDKGTPTQPTVLAYRWMDLDGDRLLDLVVSPTRGGLNSYNFYKGNKPWAQPIETPLVFGDFSDAAFGACASFINTAPNAAQQPYTMCNGKVPWFFYKGHGDGTFGVPGPQVWPYPTRVLYQPIPLETSAGDSSLFSYPIGEQQGVADLDGDGAVDGATTPNPFSWTTWSTWRNDHSGALVPQTPSAAFSFGTGTSFSFAKSNVTPDFTDIQSVEGLFDISGDGLTDHWTWTGASANFALNDGLQFRWFGSGEITTPVRPATKASAIAYTWDGGQPARASRWDYSTTADYDLDGRVDVSQGDFNFKTTFLNFGGTFGNSVAPIGWLTSLAHTITSTDQVPYYIGGPGSMGGALYAWEIRSDMIDLDGDSIPEGVDFGGNLDNWWNPAAMLASRIPTPTQPPRLLIGINNGQGASTSISYGAASDPNAVTQAAGKRLPQTQWVVTRIDTTDTAASPQTVSTTGYQYSNPVYGTDDEGRYAFRGFEQVRVNTPTGAIRDETFSFSPDWSGRLVKTVMKPGEAPNEARTIDETVWEARQLFSGVLTTYHPIVRKHYVCANGQTEATCSIPASAAGYSQTTSTLSATTGGATPALMWLETSSLVQAGTAAADGDRKSDVEYNLLADDANYRLVTISETKLHRVSGAFTTYAKTEHKWTETGDTSFRVPWSTSVWIDNNYANRLTTARDYDLSTGNLTRIWKPVQWAPNQNRSTNLNRTSLTYDVRKLFVATEVNELGHARDYTHEYGTGTRLATYGPNVPGCAPSSCPPGSPTREEHRIRVDGMGRMIERYEAFAVPPNVFALRKVETNAYIDAPLASVTHQAAIEFVESTSTIRYSQDKTEVDGHGRPLRTTLYALGSAAADQVTSYSYNNAGHLVQVTVPNPKFNTTSTVAYTYTSDSLGRPLSIRRPDAISAADKSGVDISYNGLSETRTEIVGTALGVPASTTSYSDVFGRLVRVDEKRSVSPIAWATTTYAHGPDDNVITIVDPQGVTTSMVHDFAGRRTQITRNTRVWTYGYDANGNMISETAPCTGGSCAALYTTTVAFDALDRPTSKSLAPRTLSAGDLALFGAASETFTWDTAVQGIGRLHQWRSFAPSGGTPVSMSAFDYTTQGQEQGVTQTTNAAGYTNLSRAFGRWFNISGTISAAWYGDVVGTTNCQGGSAAFYAYDNRGLLGSVQVQGCVYGPTPYSYLANTRNVAGLVTKRNSVPGNGTITYAESNWSYDELGRVSSQVINKGSPLVQVARQDLQYFGNDNPKSMDHYLGATNQKHFNFTFDPRHQLATVGETQLPNAFTATYTYGTAGRFATAVESAATLPNGDVTPRNVTYIYSGTDPERITALRKNPGTKNLATYTWDDGGNQLNRTYPDTKEAWDYVYDGKNQLRRVTKKLNGAVQGSEEYWYDGANQRYLTVKRNASGTKTGAIWFIGDTEAHYDAAGVVTRAFGHVTMGTPVARTDRSSDGPSTLEYQFHGLGNNTIATVDQVTGTINASFTYAPFGEVIEATNAGGATNGLPVHKRRFNDKFVDEVSGLSYYGFRYYDRLSMAWTQSDPLYRFVPDAAKASSPRRASLYAFTLNNPLRYLDPDGRDSKERPGGQGVWIDPNGPNCNGVTSLCQGKNDAEGDESSTDEWNPWGMFNVLHVDKRGNRAWGSPTRAELVGQIVTGGIAIGGALYAGFFGASALVSRWLVAGGEAATYGPIGAAGAGPAMLAAQRACKGGDCIQLSDAFVRISGLGEKISLVPRVGDRLDALPGVFDKAVTLHSAVLMSSGAVADPLLNRVFPNVQAFVATVVGNLSTTQVMVNGAVVSP